MRKRGESCDDVAVMFLLMGDVEKHSFTKRNGGLVFLQCIRKGMCVGVTVYNIVNKVSVNGKRFSSDWITGSDLAFATWY